MAPPSKRPPQGRRPGQGKRPPQGKGGSSARTPAGANGSNAGTTSRATGAAATPAEGNSVADERKAKREAARQERIAIARRKKKAKRQRQSLIAGIVVLSLLGAIFYGVNKSRNEGKAAARAATAAGCSGIQQVKNEGREHKPVAEISPDTYKSNPPTSGTHAAEGAANWGSYNEETPAATLVHNLEHGGIVIHYKDQSDEQIDAIASFVDGYTDGVVSNPNPKIETPIAIASWDSKQGCKTFSPEAVAGYIRERCNKGPEKIATCRS